MALRVIQVTNKTFFSMRTSCLFRMAYTSINHTSKSKSSHQKPIAPSSSYPPTSLWLRVPSPYRSGWQKALGSFRDSLTLGHTGISYCLHGSNTAASRNGPRRTSGWSRTEVNAVLTSTRVVLSEEHKMPEKLLDGPCASRELAGCQMGSHALCSS